MRRFVKLPLPAKVGAFALLEGGAAASITEAITRASLDWEECCRDRHPRVGAR